MKKILCLLALVLFSVALAQGCTSAQDSMTKGADMENKKILIAYYSYSGNTKTVAEKIQKQTGGDLFRIETVNSYPSGYNEVVEQAKKEKQEDYHPPLKAKVDNIGQYDIVFLGTPVWWYTMAPAVKTFIKENNMSNKTVIPFCTHGGGGASSTFVDMQKLIPYASFKKGLVIYDNGGNTVDAEIKKWIEQVL